MHVSIPLRPVDGVTASLDGRHSIDYYSDSVTTTIGLSTRRPSRVPYRRNIQTDVGAPFISLLLLIAECSQCLLWQSIADKVNRHNLRKRVINNALRLGEHSPRQLPSGRLSLTEQSPWTLEFKQSSLHHISQVLRSRLRYSLFHSSSALLTGCVSP